MFHLDANIYGNPDLGLTQTQSGQFVEGEVRPVGRGQYREYNPTSPIPVSLIYTWPSQVYNQFRTSWGLRTELNRGANWFTVDLPLMLPFGEDADAILYPKIVEVTDPVTGETEMIGKFQRYRASVTAPYSASVVGISYWSVHMSLEIDSSEALVL